MVAFLYPGRIHLIPVRGFGIYNLLENNGHGWFNPRAVNLQIRFQQLQQLPFVNLRFVRDKIRVIVFFNKIRFIFNH